MPLVFEKWLKRLYRRAGAASREWLLGASCFFWSVSVNMCTFSNGITRNGDFPFAILQRESKKGLNLGSTDLLKYVPIV